MPLRTGISIASSFERPSPTSRRSYVATDGPSDSPLIPEEAAHDRMPHSSAPRKMPASFPAPHWTPLKSSDKSAMQLRRPKDHTARPSAEADQSVPKPGGGGRHESSSAGNLPAQT